jgi:hypothetical protein
MKFLTSFFAVLFLLSVGFWAYETFFGQGGSGAGVFAGIVAFLYVLVLGINKARTGEWFTDSSVRR